MQMEFGHFHLQVLQFFFKKLHMLVLLHFNLVSTFVSLSFGKISSAFGLVGGVSTASKTNHLLCEKFHHNARIWITICSPDFQCANLDSGFVCLDALGHNNLAPCHGPHSSLASAFFLWGPLFHHASQPEDSSWGWRSTQCFQNSIALQASLERVQHWPASPLVGSFIETEWISLFVKSDPLGHLLVSFHHASVKRSSSSIPQPGGAVAFGEEPFPCMLFEELSDVLEEDLASPAACPPQKSNFCILIAVNFVLAAQKRIPAFVVQLNDWQNRAGQGRTGQGIWCKDCCVMLLPLKKISWWTHSVILLACGVLHLNEWQSSTGQECVAPQCCCPRKNFWGTHFSTSC